MHSINYNDKRIRNLYDAAEAADVLANKLWKMARDADDAAKEEKIKEKYLSDKEIS